jgi:hypothetical protein
VNAVRPSVAAKMRPVMNDPEVPPSAENTTISPVIGACFCSGSELSMVEQIVG